MKQLSYCITKINIRRFYPLNNLSLKLKIRMAKTKKIDRTRAQESTNAIEKLYISMRHLFSRGFYKPMGVSGETLRKSLLSLRPEIYGSIAEDRIELNGLRT